MTETTDDAQQYATVEELSFNLFSYLRALPGFQDLKTEFRPEATPGELEQWQDGNEPFVLPADLKGFLQITDGMSLRWKAESLQTEITVGAVDLNCLNRIERMEDVDSLLQRSAAASGAHPQTLLDVDLESHPRPEHVAAFILERNPKVGDVALVYELDGGGAAASPHDDREPTVWFRDKGGGWHYVAASFTCYYRLLVVHLGILGWQYAFTPQGLDPLSVQWMRLYCPERLMLDTQFQNPASPLNGIAGAKHGMTAVAPSSLLMR
jgi:hypothetical protein